MNNNQSVLGWSVDDIGTFLLPSANQMNAIPTDNELVELLWSNGHVVMQRTDRRPTTINTELKQSKKSEQSTKCEGSLGNSSNPTLDDGSPASFQNSLADIIGKEFGSGFFSEMPTADTIGANKLNRDPLADQTILSRPVSKQPGYLRDKSMLPPKSIVVSSSRGVPRHGNDALVKFPQRSQPLKADLLALSGQLGKKLTKTGTKIGNEEPSTMSVCGSNQVYNIAAESHTLGNDAKCTIMKIMKPDAKAGSSHGMQTNTKDTSGGSWCGVSGTEKKNGSNHSQKRKARESENSEYLSEETENEFFEANNPISASRTRAAEVHNLSERRRRDRINEKMKALQDLIPQCNKSDKASMLDEAIEYLKSLQLQVQMMWLGSGIPPMMFPGIQQYMPRMGMAMTQAPMPSIHSPIQLPGVPVVNQLMPLVPTENYTSMCPPSALNQIIVPPPMQNALLPDSYARYLGFQHMQPSPQAMNLSAVGSYGMQNQPTPDGLVSEKH